MNIELYIEIWTKDWFQHGFISALGSIAYYLYQIRKKTEEWNFKSLVIHFIMGFFVGNLVSDFIPEESEYELSTLLLVGYSSYVILGNLEQYGANIFAKFTQNITSNTNNNNKK